MSGSHIKENRVISLNRLIPHPDNYRIHPDEQISDLILSLKRFGQGRSIIVQDGPNELLTVGGHGVVEAARQVGWTELRADVLPADWTPSQIRGYLIADNLHSEKSTDDEDVLSRLLKEQQEAGFDLASLGTDEEALRDMLAKMTPPTLDELTAQYGDEPEEDAFWPVIRVKVSPNTKELYDSLMEEAEESVKFAWILERVNVAIENEDEEEVTV
jgi:ParB-like chromosome segregation protein Spo0J